MAERIKLLSLARDLLRRKARERDALFVAEGLRTVEELLRSPLTVRGVLASTHIEATERGRTLLEQCTARSIQVATVSDRDFATAAGTDTPQGILAIASIPSRSLAEVPDTAARRVLIIDAVQDPGNVGTMLRTAAALGVDATVALPGTADIWNAKVVRAAMGALFHHPVITDTWEGVDRFRARCGMTMWGADARGVPVPADQRPDRLGLIVGNEGGGLSDAARERADLLVALPLTGGIESLNVAVAAGILLFELRPT